MMDFKIKDDKIKKQRNTNKLDEKVQTKNSALAN